MLTAGPALADDRDILTAYLEDTLSSVGRQITITGFRGALASQATIDQMTIADGTGIYALSPFEIGRTRTLA